MSAYKHVLEAIKAFQEEGKPHRATELTQFARRSFPGKRAEISDISNPSRAAAKQAAIPTGKVNTKVWQHPSLSKPAVITTKAEGLDSEKKPLAGAAEQETALPNKVAVPGFHGLGEEEPTQEDGAVLLEEEPTVGIFKDGEVTQHPVKGLMSATPSDIVSLFGGLAGLKDFLQNQGAAVKKNTREGKTVEAFKEYLKTLS